MVEGGWVFEIRIRAEDERQSQKRVRLTNPLREKGDSTISRMGVVIRKILSGDNYI